MNHRLIGTVVICVLILMATPVVVTAADFDVMTEESINVADRSVEQSGTTFEINSITQADPTDKITANVNAPSDTDVTMYLYDKNGKTLKAYEGTGPTNFDVSIADHGASEPGTYALVVQSDGVREAVHPLVVRGYSISANAPGSATMGNDISVDGEFTQLRGDQYDQIDIVMTATDTETEVITQADIDGETFSTSVSTQNTELESGSYDVYAVIRGSDTVLGRQEILGVSSPQLLEIEADESENSNDDDGSDGDNSGDDSGGGGGDDSGGDGGGAAGGQGTEDSTVDSGPPTPRDVRDTLNLVESANEATINDDSSSTKTEENRGSDQPQSPRNTQSSVTAVEFEGETQHSVSVTDYGTPPQTVEEKVIDSIAAYNSGVNPATDSGSNSAESTDSDSETDESGTAADDGDSDVIEPQSSPSDSSDGSDDTDDGSDIRVVSLSDISPTEEIGDEETTATVTFSVERNEVTNPNQLTVYKEEYVFEAQEEQWIELETSVSKPTGEEVEVTAETTEFSLFAVTETVSEQSQPSGSNNETATSSQNNSTGTTDQTPGFGITSVVIVILTVIGLSRHRK